MMFPAPFRDEEHRQDDQRELAQQPRIAAVARSWSGRARPAAPAGRPRCALISSRTNPGGSDSMFTSRSSVVRPRPVRPGW